MHPDNRNKLRERVVRAAEAALVRFSRTRKRYERQGLLVESEVLKQAADALEVKKGQDARRV